MKVFISWSGALSCRIAKLLYQCLPEILPSITPFISTEIRKGRLWPKEILEQLKGASVGIICVTPDSLINPWLNFEAGALVTSDASVCTILFGISPSEVKGPLSCFQMTCYTKSDFWKLILTLNSALSDDLISESDLAESFEIWWPKIRYRLNTILFKEELPIAYEPLRTYLLRALRRAKLGIFIIFLGIIIIVISFYTNNQFEDPYDKTWSNSKGRLIHFEYKNEPNEEDRQKYSDNGIPVSELNVMYEYTVDGEIYKGSVVGQKNKLYKKELQNYMNQVNHEVNVYYEISDPNNCALEKPTHWIPCIFCSLYLIGACIIFGGFNLIVNPNALDPKKTAKSQ